MEQTFLITLCLLLIACTEKVQFYNSEKKIYSTPLSPESPPTLPPVGKENPQPEPPEQGPEPEPQPESPEQGPEPESNPPEAETPNSPSPPRTENSVSVSINTDTLMNIHSASALNFQVEGSCSEEGQNIVVSIGEITPPTQPTCSLNGTWLTEVNVTSLISSTTTSIIVTADHSTTGGLKAPQASTIITSRICPDNFVMVPPLKNYTDESFCMAKYEMKNSGSDTAISQADGTPYINISRDESINKCQAMGSGYDLITNDEWQTIARNIELVKSNWKNQRIGKSTLNTGHHSSDAVTTATPMAANSNDNQACFGTPKDCDSSTWNIYKRTHNLSNGEVVWDMSGNVSEWIKEDNSVNYSQGYIVQLSYTYPGPRGV